MKKYQKFIIAAVAVIAFFTTNASAQSGSKPKQNTAAGSTKGSGSAGLAPNGGGTSGTHGGSTGKAINGGGSAGNQGNEIGRAHV